MLDTRPAPPAPRGARSAIRPTGRERSFSADELIVSKTDPRGVITYANDVFLRVSGYRQDEVLGQPHNMIRHPEMPRAVFKLLWDTLTAGQEVFAYINNLAADGGHYWVLAHVTPSYDAGCRTVGYHSNRRRPARGAVQRVLPLYQRLLDEERRHPNARAATEASSRLLADVLDEQGQTYEEFIWSVINREES
ncbi:PAS domain-containing protein [Blastococcus xanthinilyticus]|uniref:PAS domain S-box-containing protein n=1 Tax=Blastococcus xanthinilyticus TaxID=1564164 RepID=A0A5S5CVW0_9ACTN|nr:PAS domain-containing protein [Blastococcus xanthinilyticus]TYP87931.1 PAS domain S-box-containing protein [Blastococcus xanthinilyticus]